MENGKKRKVEIVAIVAIVILAVVIIGVRMNISGKAAKENALMDQLRNVRSAVQLYFAVNSKYPASLKTLVSEKYTIGNKRGLYLTGIVVDKESEPLDSFGQPFKYDPSSGKVTAGEKSYEAW